MESADLTPLIEILDDNIDDLEEALAPLLKVAMSDTAGKLPLLDKAHLYVLVTYAIESILFSCLRLSGVKAKEHPVFRELTRVKQYFEKIKAAEFAGGKPSARIDREAAGRFIRHALAGNDRYDLKLGDQWGKVKNSADNKFEDNSKKRKLDGRKDVASGAISLSSESDVDYPESSDPEPHGEKATAATSQREKLHSNSAKNGSETGRVKNLEVESRPKMVDGEQSRERKTKRLHKKWKTT